MTLMFAPLAGLLAGMLLGRRWAAYAAAGTVWYVGLAAQTAYLAKPGASDFLNKSGNSTIRHLPYWIVQPPILGIAVLLVLAGARLRSRIVEQRHSGSAAGTPQVRATRP